MKSQYLVGERIGSDAKRIEMHPGLFERIDGFVHCDRCRAEVNGAELGRFRAFRRQEPVSACCGLEFLEKPLHLVHINGTFFAVARKPIAAMCRA